MNKKNICFCLFSLWSMSLSALQTSLGVAIEPMEIKINDNRKGYFTVYNDTDDDYILIQKVITDDVSDSELKVPFIVNPPMRLIKGRSDVTMGVIYLLDDGFYNVKKQNYFLSVTFIPKKDIAQNDISVPVLLSQQIPIIF
ncbi:fimbria/pilus periplasmic chaperone [Escherichia coli]|uniref:fimbria/pilus periplasmic chaperone n=2 Tax=Escherichia coli TaxID=562 RepID=UPI00200A5DCA|nr:fimbria/pilus periplasmic chaperone [Escherichia coli]